ncbi:MAG: NADH-quinone oxidoreductase subunit M [Puniceicoccales bacterium]|jgi:NADH-quinone oxidoreductase subunit M|nr:NADH-quinone oxidoreductase subunit M [Puniceicoccales bacterium]
MLSPYADMLLPLALAVPFAASLLLFAMGRRGHAGLVNAVAAVGFVFPAVAGAVAWAAFADNATGAGGYAFLKTLPVGVDALGIALTLGLNGVSLPLFALAGVVGAAAGIQALSSEGTENRAVYFGLLLFMLGGLLGVFASVDIFFFYFFHEFALIPAFILILGGGGVGRRTAAIQMAVYLTLGAMVSLAGIILLFLKSGAGSFNLIALRAALATAPMSEGDAITVAGLLLLGFGILVSLFPFHSWAPATYTEAPTPVSMLHAGVLKKFGLYGLIQLGALAVPSGLAHWAPVLFWLALGNILFIGLVTLSQRHLKEMVSYSSVMHMGPCFMGIYAFSAGGGHDTTGLGAAVFLMFAHGLSVAALFALSHGVYRRTGTLDFGESGGLAKRAPVLAAFFIAAGMASIGLPGFGNFWGELGVFVSLGKLPVWQLLLVVSSIVISAIYVLRAVASVFLGEEPEALARRCETAPIGDITWSERCVSGLLLAVLVAVGFYPRLLSDALNKALGN